MRQIAGVALGTYYAAGAVAGRETPNASAMRGLVYAVKDNREPPNQPQRVAHPRHPAYPSAVLVDRSNAIEYVTAIVTRYRSRLAELFGASLDEITLVPVPSSQVTATTIETARFPTLRLCRALAGVGLGTVRVLVAQKRPITPKTAGHRRTADEILDDLERTDQRMPRSGAIVIVDDNVQSGQSLAALDHLLGGTLPVSAFAVALTDSQRREDACRPRRFTVSCDDTTRPIVVSLTRDR